MSRRISDETKRRRGMGSGSGKSYSSYLNPGEFSSEGTTSTLVDWKTGRQVHCLSQGETMWYYILRWDDRNVDIREQYPLDNAKTNQAALQCGVKHPGNENYIMTTDFFVTEEDGSRHAYSVKPDRKCLKDNRTLEKLCIEKTYWLNEGCKFDMLFKEDANEVLAGNIRRVVEYYSLGPDPDFFDVVKHKIAIKEYEAEAEMKSAVLDAETLRNIWKRCR